MGSRCVVAVWKYINFGRLLMIRIVVECVQFLSPGIGGFPRELDWSIRRAWKCCFDCRDDNGSVVCLNNG